jgi:hypothetical protein
MIAVGLAVLDRTLSVHFSSNGNMPLGFTSKTFRKKLQNNKRG